MVRCLALAHILKNDFKITFFCKEIPESTFTEFNRSGFGCIRIAHEEEFLRQITPNIIVIIDSYDLDTNYQKQIKASGAKLVCIDDLHDKEFVADLIINHSPGVTPQDYKAQPHTQFALGPEYALLRQEFLEQANKQRTIEKIETVMICFGGSDFNNLTFNTLKAIQPLQNFKKIIVVTGGAYKIIPEFQFLIKNDKRLIHKHNLNAEEMLETMMEAELAVVSASSIAFEVICSGCNLMICLSALNQVLFHEYLVQKLNVPSFGDNSCNFKENIFMEQITNVCGDKQNNKLLSLRKQISLSEFNIIKLFHDMKLY